MNEFESICREKGIDMILASNVYDNTNGFYEKLGYENLTVNCYETTCFCINSNILKAEELEKINEYCEMGLASRTDWSNALLLQFYEPVKSMQSKTYFKVLNEGLKDKGINDLLNNEGMAQRESVIPNFNDAWNNYQKNEKGIKSLKELLSKYNRIL